MTANLEADKSQPQTVQIQDMLDGLSVIKSAGLQEHFASEFINKNNEV